MRRLSSWMRGRDRNPPQAETPAVDPAVVEMLAHQPKLVTNLDILARLLGQAASIDQRRPIAANGSPIPWFTYPALEYLGQWDFSGKYVFEYGCGYSTAYWSHRGARVWSVEHDRDWIDEMTGFGLEGVELLHRSERDSYAAAIMVPGRKMDVIVIDGVWREDCVRHCLSYLAPDGFLILDNSDWYWEAGRYIRDQGFLEVSFSGFGPINDYTSTTSLFFPGRPTSQRNFQPPRPVGGNIITKEDESDEMW